MSGSLTQLGLPQLSTIGDISLSYRFIGLVPSGACHKFYSRYVQFSLACLPIKLLNYFTVCNFQDFRRVYGSLLEVENYHTRYYSPCGGGRLVSEDLVSSQHNYVTYAVHNYVCLQFSTFGMEIYQQLYTPPMTVLVFSTFWVGIGYKFFVSNSTKLCSKLRGGADVCLPLST